MILLTLIDGTDKNHSNSLSDFVRNKYLTLPAENFNT